METRKKLVILLLVPYFTTSTCTCTVLYNLYKHNTSTCSIVFFTCRITCTICVHFILFKLTYFLEDNGSCCCENKNNSFSLPTYVQLYTNYFFHNHPPFLKKNYHKGQNLHSNPSGFVSNLMRYTPNSAQDFYEFYIDQYYYCLPPLPRVGQQGDFNLEQIVAYVN